MGVNLACNNIKSKLVLQSHGFLSSLFCFPSLIPSLSHQMAFSNIAMVLCFFLAINMALPTLATFYTVGDSLGWQIGVEYSKWTSEKTFVVGDSLGKWELESFLYISFQTQLNACFFSP